MRKNSDLVVSYLTLRQMIGWIGLVMPFVVRAGAIGFQRLPTQGSVSAYYYTGMRDIFVSTLVLVGALMICNRTKRIWDNIVSIVAGLAAIGIALFPMDYDNSVGQCPTCVIHWFLGHHYTFVVIFFALCFVMVFFQFPGRTPSDAWKEMRMRNIIYRVCGVVMLLSFIAIGIVQSRHKPESFFWPESIAVFAFGVAWLVKGQTVLKDKPGAPLRSAS